MTGVAGDTTSVADIFNSPRLAVAACVAVITVEPTPTMLTVRPPAPPIVATFVLLLEKVKPTVVSVDVGSLRSNAGLPNILGLTVKLLNEADTTRGAVTIPVL